ncbi:MAG: PHP domain-containing protein, partial [Planctomycetes bacterium]|nr:PHP domain-containing protein [Planctomycetota bacterium]
MYVSLHNRSAYSFGTALTTPEQLVEFAVRHHMPAIGLTDLDGLYAAIPFYQACRAAGIHPIIGAEITVQCGPGGGCGTGFQPVHPVRVTLLARNITGYGNLCRLVSLRQLREQLLRIEDLREHAQGLICVGGIAQPFGLAAEQLAGLRAAFGEDFYLELVIHDPEGTTVARRLAEVADELGVPVVATCESRCLAREDHLLLRALSSVGTLTLLDQPHPDKPVGTWHLRTPDEMQRLFGRRPDALDNTLAIAEQCDLRLDLDRNRFPPSSAPLGRTAMQHLRELCVAGCRWRYVDTLPQKGIGGKRPTLDEALQRLERELAVIDEVHYAEYFLVFHEIVQYCRSQGISSLARGSAADSLVCYALGVSHACPFRFDLPFDRFLNPERARFSKMADIDLDLPW